MIHVFHGFLGSPEDFSYLKNQNSDVVIHDLYKMTQMPVISEGDTLIGYSMGGRIALDIALAHNYQLKKVVLINAHPGLSSDEEKMERAKWETSLIRELETKSKEDFFEEWNNLPIFFHDAPLKVSSEERYQESKVLFDKYRLSNQADHLPEIVKHKDKVLYIVGLFDEKYMDLASDYLLPHDVTVKGIPAGHRLFQHEKELLKVLSDEGIL
jgi:2-succinyl-6-hydroxy-2,4-cyclohexadiene-1-carboxylate synthase